jgi:hypothetical protein
MESLPLWFLLLSLVLPRVCLVIAYFHHDLTSYPLHGWIPPALAVVFPRVLLIVLVYLDRGFSGWLVAHAVFLFIVYVGCGKQQKTRRSCKEQGDFAQPTSPQS